MGPTPAKRETQMKRMRKGVQGRVGGDVKPTCVWKAIEEWETSPGKWALRG